MGLTRSVACNAAACTPAVVQQAFASCGFPVQMRMIDGQLAFPDEAPPEHWREIRVSTPAGMVTIQRQEDRLDLVTWGNADAALMAARDKLAEELATRVCNSV